MLVSKLYYWYSPKSHIDDSHIKQLEEIIKLKKNNHSNVDNYYFALGKAYEETKKFNENIVEESNAYQAELNNYKAEIDGEIEKIREEYRVE